MRKTLKKRVFIRRIFGGTVRILFRQWEVYFNVAFSTLRTEVNFPYKVYKSISESCYQIPWVASEWHSCEKNRAFSGERRWSGGQRAQNCLIGLILHGVGDGEFKKTERCTKGQNPAALRLACFVSICKWAQHEKPTITCTLNSNIFTFIQKTGEADTKPEETIFTEASALHHKIKEYKYLVGLSYNFLINANWTSSIH